MSKIVYNGKVIKLRELNKMNAIEKGYIPFLEYAEKNKLDKADRSQLRRESLKDGINFIILTKKSNDFYINPDYTFEKNNLSPDELFFNSLLKRYNFLDIKFQDKMIIVYGYVVSKNKSTGRYIISNFIDAVEFIYEKIKEVINVNENNTYDYCPNHLISCFN